MLETIICTDTDARRHVIEITFVWLCYFLSFIHTTSEIHEFSCLGLGGTLRFTKEVFDMVVDQGPPQHPGTLCILQWWAAP